MVRADTITHGSRGSKRSGDDIHRHGADQPNPLPASKRQRRGRYVSQACMQCRQRKVKCDGNLPCQPCLLSERRCSQNAIDLRRRKSVRDEVSARHVRESIAGEGSDSSEDPAVIGGDVLTRLDRVERQLQFIINAVCPSSNRRDTIDAETGSVNRLRVISIENEPCTALKSKGFTHNEVDSFSGETSIRHALEEVEGRLETIQGSGGPADDSPYSQISTPVLTPSPHHEKSGNKSEHDHHRNILQMYDIEPKRSQWDKSLDTFCIEVHILYPFLHLPTLRNKYDAMWSSFASSSETDNHHSKISEIDLAQLLICIAIGQCTESPRLENQEGRHSAGWSVYRAAYGLIGDLLDSFGNCPDSLQLLQTLALMVIYLFRLDIFGKAGKLLALAVSHAHHLGLHRSRVVHNLSPFQSEMSRRMWWSLYILDRRVAIETGHPFLIQNINVDTPLPRPLDDDQLSRFRNCPEVDLETLQPSETGGPYTTSFPYFRAMIAYSQLLGKVWEGLYGAASLDLAPNHSLREHLERLLFRAQKDIHPEFAHPHYGPRAAQFVETPWWLMKQQALMRTRWLSVRLLIRRPLLYTSVSPDGTLLDSFENEVTCIQIANSIIEEVSRFPEEKVIFTFPFLHYLIGATITSLGLIMKENTFKAAYGGATIYAVRLLESYCAKTWVSGKLIRVVSRLRHMASRLLRDGDIVGSGLPLYKHSSQAFPGIQDARAREAEVGRSEIPSMAHSCPEPSSPSAGERELIGPPDMNIRPGVACESISQMPPLHGRDTTEPYLPTQALSFDGLGSLVMSDFDFEEGVPGGSRFGTLPPGDASIQPLPNDQPEGGAGTSHTRPLTMHNDLAAGEPVAPYNIRNSGDSGMEEMEWLEALFGNYVNSDFIPRQYT